MKICAYAAKTFKGELAKWSYDGKIGPYDVLIDIQYCGISRGDVLFIDNRWGDTHYPLVPGYEIFGTIKDKGIKVKDLEIGEYVGAGYQISSCMECQYCKKGKEQFCKKQKVLLVSGYGGASDVIIVDNRFVYKISEKLRKPEYVPLMCSGLTPYSAIKKVGIHEGMKVGLVGIGNLGHLALQILVAFGAEVTVFSHDQTKKEALLKLGAHKFVSSTDLEVLQEHEGNFDAIFSTSSGTLDWELYMRMLTLEGTICFIGLPPDNISFPATVLSDYAQRTIQGSYIGSRSEMKDLLKLAEVKDIKATIELFPMEKINDVIDKVRNNQIIFSTVVENK
ncbi:MAG: NAD(P)-dependent alcohol dehydrogenase [Candidatus Roizmanbacteria bacterium]|nr:NAD(P)-dependent alcohol dehydrogenase [Candidatus Roizmanbacteria bacterium]